MPEVASVDQELLDQIDAALRKFERPASKTDSDPGAEGPAGGRGTRWLLTLFACLTVIYHADHAMAQVIEGETTDGHVFVSWEYDLESGMGQILIRNIDVPRREWQSSLYLAGLFPERVAGLNGRWPIFFDRCPGSGTPPNLVFAFLDPGREGTVEFSFCEAQTNSGMSLPPCSIIQTATQEVEYGSVRQWSAACFFFPGGSLRDFVTVRPLECGASDRDADNDVDLRDFADFQVNTPPEQLPCFDSFYNDLTGPR